MAATKILGVTSSGISAALARAAKAGHLPSAAALAKSALQADVLKNPVALFYDMDAWEGTINGCRDAFGPKCLHAIAIKSNPVAGLLRRAVADGFGLECASIGEVMHARSMGCAPDRIIFDSPCKSIPEIAYALRAGIHMNMDNFEELDRVISLRSQIPDSKSSIGIRVNPESGSGTIAELSVSTAKGKFGISGRFSDKIVDACLKYEWINCIHVHVGSGNMGTDTLVTGVKFAVDLAQKINAQAGRRQITVLDMGGGLAADYSSDVCPDFHAYTENLRRQIPGLLADGKTEQIFDRVITEFGQAMNAKSGFLASRIEYLKKTADGVSQLPVIHFGADTCVRQCYTTAHKRRLEFYDGTTFQPCEGELMSTDVAGPLCFQGDMLAKDMQAPRLRMDDVIVLREAGSNTLSLFSRHCSRLAPPVLGYRLAKDQNEVEELVVLKSQEDLASLCGFWGGEVSREVASSLCDAENAPSPKKAKL